MIELEGPLSRITRSQFIDRLEGRPLRLDALKADQRFNGLDLGGVDRNGNGRIEGRNELKELPPQPELPRQVQEPVEQQQSQLLSHDPPRRRPSPKASASSTSPLQKLTSVVVSSRRVTCWASGIENASTQAASSRKSGSIRVIRQGR